MPEQVPQPHNGFEITGHDDPAAADIDEYMQNRPYIDEMGTIINPATDQPATGAEADYFETQKNAHYDSTQAKPYEDMDIHEVTDAMSAAHSNRDGSIVNETQVHYRQKVKETAEGMDVIGVARQLARPEIQADKTTNNIIKDVLTAKIASQIEQAEDRAASAATSETDPVKVSVGQAEQEKNGQDTILRSDDKKLYAVCDGAGGGKGNPKAASVAAAEGISISYENNIKARDGQPFKNLEEAKQTMEVAVNFARKNTDENGQNGITTAAIMKTEVIDGVTYGIWANIGDSRIYIRNDDGEINQITTDQGAGNRIDNALGQGTTNEKDEIGAVVLNKGDRVMICSDGITGDYSEQFFTDEEMADAFNQPTAERSASRFLQISNQPEKKKDDKSVLVIDIEEAPEVELNEVESAEPETAPAHNQTQEVEQENPAPESEPAAKIGLIDRVNYKLMDIKNGNISHKEKSRLKKAAVGVGALAVGLFAHKFLGFNVIDSHNELSEASQHSGGLMPSSAPGQKASLLADLNPVGTDSAQAATPEASIKTGSHFSSPDSLANLDASPSAEHASEMVSADVRQGDGLTNVIDRQAASHGFNLNDAQLYEAYQHMERMNGFDLANTYKLPNGDLGIADSNSSVKLNTEILEDFLKKKKLK